MDQCVCHITTVHPATDTRIFYRECLSLLQAGYEVHLVAQAEQDMVREGVSIHALPRWRNRLDRLARISWLALVKALRIRATVYHYHDPELILLGFVLRWVFRKRVIYDIHESVHRQLASKHWLPKYFRKPMAMIYRFLERCLCVGQTLVVASEFSMPDYPQGCLVRNYPSLPAESEMLPAETTHAHHDSGIPLLIYVGGVSRIRGADLYVDLAAELLRRGRAFRMLIVGPDHDGSIIRLTERLQREKLDTHVQFTGPVDNPRAMDLVRRASLGLCLLMPEPNYVQSLATKILEYMLYGVPVLASDFDCWRPYVEGTGAGCMVDPHNLDQVAAVCCQMLDDVEGRRAMARRGADAVRSKYNWQLEFRKLLSCYRALSK